MADTPLISVVSPVYKAEQIVPELVKRIAQEVSPITGNFEIILVEDGSPDGSWTAIEREATGDDRVKAIKLSRNYGQHTALAAGIDYATGNYIVVMDCDLQDDPAYIPALYKLAKQDFDIAYTRKHSRQHSAWRNASANFYNRIFRILAGNSTLQGYDNVGGYSIISRKAAEAYKVNSHHYHHYLSILRSTGLPHTFLDIEHRERFDGSSSYTLSKLLTHALNGVTLPSEKSLRAVISTGFILSLISCIALVILIILYFTTGHRHSWMYLLPVLLLAAGIFMARIAINSRAAKQEPTEKRSLYTVEKLINGR